MDQILFASCKSVDCTKKTVDYAPKFVDCMAEFDYTAGFDCTTGFVDYLTNIQIKIVFFAHISAKVFEKIFVKMLVVEMFVVEMFVVFFT